MIYKMNINNVYNNALKTNPIQLCKKDSSALIIVINYKSLNIHN